MKTTKTFWISLTATAAGCAALLVFQSAGTRSLAGRLESKKALVAELEREEQANSIPDIVGNWAERDFNAAGAWLGTMEASPAKDAAIQRFVQTVVEVDPQSAAVWAGSIEGERAKAVSLVHASEQWLAKDRPAAEK